MTATARALRTAVDLATALRHRATRHPLEAVRWLPLQADCLRSSARRRLLRAGEQTIGKSTVGVAELVFAAEGHHPHRAPTKRPGEYWLICDSWSQSVAIQGKLWDLVSKDRLRERQAYNPKRGFPGQALELQHASGGWSVIRVKTTRQGEVGLASATIDGAVFDEPPRSQSLYTQVAKRVMRRQGWVLLTLTPLGYPVEWLRELCEAGDIVDFHRQLTAREMIPEGALEPLRLPDGTPCDADWIAQLEADTPAHQVGIRVHGEWDLRATAGYFAGVWRPTEHVVAPDQLPTEYDRLYLGIDHGHRPGKQVAVLVGVRFAGYSPHVYVLDEYADDLGSATPLDDARGILAMLARNGLTWESLDGAIGDRVHLPGSGAQKSNRDLEARIAQLRRVATGGTATMSPGIRTVRKGRDSSDIGSRWLYQRIGKGEFKVSAVCKRVAAAIPKYAGPGPDHDAKDPIDGIRYGLEEVIFEPVARPEPVPLQVR